MQHRRPHQRGVAALQDRKVCFEHFVQYSPVRERTAKTHERYDSEIGSYDAIAEKLGLHFDLVPAILAGMIMPHEDDTVSRFRYACRRAFICSMAIVMPTSTFHICRAIRLATPTSRSA